jgi:hypothetical protein
MSVSTELPREALAGLVATHRDDPLGAELFRGQDRHQPHGAVTDDRHGLARPGLGGHGAEPAGAEHVGGGQEARHQIIGGNVGGGHQGAIGQRHPHPLRLGAAGGTEYLAVDTRGLVAGPADLAGVVGSEERADDELAGFDRAHLIANLFDDAGVFMTHVEGFRDVVGATVRPKVRPANTGGRQADDRICGLLDLWLCDVLDADVTRGVHHHTTHEDLLVVS